MLYIQFEFPGINRFEAFKRIYDLLYEIRPREESKPLEYWKELIPDYAQRFLMKYHQEENSRHYLVNESFKSMINYLEFGLEVDFEELELISEQKAVLRFSAYAFPYGGMERLLYFLVAFDCKPSEAYNGFEVITLQWTEDMLNYEVEEQPEKTKTYLAQFNR